MFLEEYEMVLVKFSGIHGEGYQESLGLGLLKCGGFPLFLFGHKNRVTDRDPFLKGNNTWSWKP